VTPETAAKIAEICGPTDRAIAGIKAHLDRVEARKRARDDGLLRAVAVRIESDPVFRAAVVMLACE
jgi:hypothetical protein